MNIGTLLIYISMIMAPVMIFMLINKKRNLVNLFNNTYIISSSLILVAGILLLNYLFNNDFRYNYVYENSSIALPFIYKLSAFWAGSEGSFLLWIILIKLSVIIYLIINKKNSDRIILITAVFIEFSILCLITVKNPFTFIWDTMPESIGKNQLPQDGLGLNALLMDPWMVLHPPVLFAGYATSVIIFAYAISALIHKKYDEWISSSFPWLLVSTATLGMGIFMGGYWSYKVLGWGGFWGWDPVENSSLVPWLISVILLHGILLQKRKGACKRLNLIFAVLYFIFIVYSTFLTKSGVLSDFSVHSFGRTDIATLLGLMLLTAIIFSVVILFSGLKNIISSKLDDRFLGFDSAVVYGIIILSVYSLIIISGTTFPIISSLLGKATAVTESFYNKLSMPFGIIIILSLILTEYALHNITKKISFIASGISVITVFIMIFTSHFNFIDSFFYLLCIFHISLILMKKNLIPCISKNISHIGISIFVLGVIISSSLSWTKNIKLNVNETVKIDNISCVLKGFSENKRSTLDILFTKGNTTTSVKMPYFIEKKSRSLYREPFIYSTVSGDYYIIPQKYNFSKMSYSRAVLREGHTHKISGYDVTFLKFRIEKMAKDGMSLIADLKINNKKYSPSISYIQDKRRNVNIKMGFTGQIISIEGVNARNKSVEISITPKKGMILPPDSAQLTVSYKPFIWLVWLGTILVTAGFVIAILRLYKNKQS